MTPRLSTLGVGARPSHPVRHTVGHEPTRCDRALLPAPEDHDDGQPLRDPGGRRRQASRGRSSRSRSRSGWRSRSRSPSTPTRRAPSRSSRSRPAPGWTSARPTTSSTPPARRSAGSARTSASRCCARRGTSGTPDGLEAFGTERNQNIAILRRVWDFMPVVGDIPLPFIFHFDFTAPDGSLVLSSERKRSAARPLRHPHAPGQQRVAARLARGSRHGRGARRAPVPLSPASQASRARPARGAARSARSRPRAGRASAPARRW